MIVIVTENKKKPSKLKRFREENGILSKTNQEQASRIIQLEGRLKTAFQQWGEETGSEKAKKLLTDLENELNSSSIRQEMLEELKKKGLCDSSTTGEKSIVCGPLTVFLSAVHLLDPLFCCAYKIIGLRIENGIFHYASGGVWPLNSTADSIRKQTGMSIVQVNTPVNTEAEVMAALYAVFGKTLKDN